MTDVPLVKRGKFRYIHTHGKILDEDGGSNYSDASTSQSMKDCMKRMAGSQ